MHLFMTIPRLCYSLFCAAKTVFGKSPSRSVPSVAIKKNMPALAYYTVRNDVKSARQNLREAFSVAM